MTVAFNILLLLGLLILLLCEELRYRRFTKTVQETHSTLSALAHRLRSPMATIRKYNEFLRSKEFGNLSIGQQEALSKMESASREMLIAFQRLLATARIDEQEIATDPVRVNILESTQMVVQAIAPLVDKQQHQLDFSSIPSHLFVHMDPLHFHGILDEILLNAFAYTPPGGRITVRAREGKESVVVSIEDTGIGIPHGERDRVFEKFFRGERASHMCDGTGLGLSFAQQLAEKYGGTISFTSEEGKGSTFTVSLPKISRK